MEQYLKEKILDMLNKATPKQLRLIYCYLYQII